MKQQEKTTMANYTTRVYDILSAYNNNTIPGYDVNKVIEEHYGDIFDLDIWDTYDHTYKKTLCEKILRHYLFYEIGFETVSRWKLAMNTKLSEIMPKYNPLYANIKKAYGDFFKDIDYSEIFTKEEHEEGEGNSNSSGITTGTGEKSSDASTTSNSDSTSKNNTTSRGSNTGTSKNASNSSSSGTASSNGDGWQASSDTPQGGLDGLESNRYLSSAVHNYSKNGSTSGTNSDSEVTAESDTETEATGTQEGNATSSGETATTGKEATKDTTNTEGHDTTTSTREKTEEYTKKIEGKSNSQNNALLFSEIASKIEAIDVMIISELKENFILLWE